MLQFPDPTSFPDEENAAVQEIRTHADESGHVGTQKTQRF